MPSLVKHFRVCRKTLNKQTNKQKTNKQTIKAYDMQ